MTCCHWGVQCRQGRLCYRFAAHDDLHVHGYRERGNINTPFELVLLNETSRFHLAMDALDRVPRLRGKVGHCMDDLRNAILDNLRYAHEQGADRPEIADWTWPD